MKLKLSRYIVLLAVIFIVFFAAGKIMGTITAMSITERVINEVGEQLPSANEFFDKSDINAYYITDISKINVNMPGEYGIEIKVNKKVYQSILEIKDTVPPVATVRDIDLYTGERVDAEQFIENAYDITDVTVSYKNEPDFSKINTQEVSLVVADTSGNTSEYKANLRISKVKESIQLEAISGVINAADFLKNENEKGSVSMISVPETLDKVGSFPVQVSIDGEAYDSEVVIVDTVPPKIYGAKKQTLYIGQPISYKKDVVAEDNCDGILDITVDSGKVNPKVEGEYIVYYTATDLSGNSVTEEIAVTVKEQSVTVDELEELADKILAEITTEDMTLREKAWEIYEYVNKHLTYVSYSDKTDWMKEAYNGITKGVGDCFTYYAMSHLFLNKIGMQTLSVERDARGDENKHYWHLVNYGEGWYHFDACIHIPKLVSFMLTDAEMDAFSRRAGKNDYYYRFKKENYPRTPVK